MIKKLANIENLLSISKVLIFLSIFFLSFNGFPYFKNIFGELHVEMSYYPLYIFVVLYSFIICFYDKFKIDIPENKNIIYLFFLLFLWIILSFVFNYNQISIHFFKKKTGLEKFFLQFIVIVFLSFVSIILYNYFKRYGLEKSFNLIQKACILTFILLAFFGFFEWLYKFTSFKLEIIKSLQLLIADNLRYVNRISFLSGEPSFYGIYLCFGFPFLLSSFFNEKKIILKMVLVFVVLFISTYSFSRTVNLILSFQLFIFSFFLFLKFRFSSVTKMFLLRIFLPSIIVLNFSFTLGDIIKSFNLKSHYASSNLNRKAMQIAGYKIGLENPFFGIGLGQYGFVFSKYVPTEFLNDYEMQTKLNPYREEWPSVHGIWARFASEIGFVGLFFWLLFWIIIFVKIFKIYKTKKFNLDFYIMSITLMTIILSITMLGFVVDSYRFLIYWYTIALSVLFIEKTKNFENV